MSEYRQQRSLRVFATLVGGVILLLAPLAVTLAEDSIEEVEDNRIVLNYEEADIREVAKGISGVINENFILDPRVDGRITLTSSRPVSPEGVYEIFHSILQVHGYAARRSGDVVKIIPSSDARQMAGSDELPDPTDFSDEVQTRLIELDHVPASQLVPVLRPLASQDAHLVAVSAANALLVADRRGNINRLEQIVNRVDQAKEDDVEVIRLEHATASEIVRILNEMDTRDRGDDDVPLSIVADERSNSVLLGGADTDRVRMRALIAHLDTPLEQAGNTEVHYVRYGDASSLAELLSGHMDDGEEEGDRVSILPDEETNALVISAPPSQMREIKSVIEKLDIRRAQVLVEAIIVEVSEDRQGELGVTWVAADRSDDATRPAAVTDFSGSGQGIADLAAGVQAGEGITQVPDGLTMGVGRFGSGTVDFAALLRALAGDTTTNILSTPTLMTMDNEEAEITVGQEVPFLTGSFDRTGAGGEAQDPRQTGRVNPFQTVQREDVGVQLQITPRINEGDAVFLDIDQEVSSISDATGATDIITNRRTINTRVIAEDGEVIVLGGLIDEQLRESEQRVPILGSIPVLGNLFRYSSTEAEKQNLMVFLKPQIIRTPDDAQHHTDAKYNLMREMQEGRTDRVRHVWGAERPQLEPLERFRRGPQHTPEDYEYRDESGLEGPQLDLGNGDGENNGDD